jgi:hypothetical protein
MRGGVRFGEDGRNEEREVTIVSPSRAPMSPFGYTGRNAAQERRFAPVLPEPSGPAHENLLSPPLPPADIERGNRIALERCLAEVCWSDLSTAQETQA